MTDTEPTAEEQLLEEGIDPGEFIGQWEFIDRLPGDDSVLTLLKTLPPVWGVKYEDYAEFVIPLPSNKKVKAKREVNGQIRDVEEYHQVITLYFGVAGRLKMLQAAQEAHGWRVDFVPEPTTPHPPGFLDMGAESERIVYREYVDIYEQVSSPTPDLVWVQLGSKPGMAWVPFKGGSQAAGSNPYEKVETAARGRALAAWGFGVIPGSGVASLEEMQATAGNRRAMQAERDVKAGVATGRKSRADLDTELRTQVEALRQIRGMEPAEAVVKLDEYTQRAFGTSVAVEDQPEVADLSRLRDGQVQLAINAFVDAIAKAGDGEAQV